MVVLARRVRPEQWKPIGVDELEANALLVVRSTDHRSIIAGPGAGKTELLAQRAAFLLQTGASPPPRRILAISFKRDAAFNLAARVSKRCHRDHARRFDSLTFDAFAKGLVDRFGQALPEDWRPTPDYEIVQTSDRLYRSFLAEVGAPPASVGTLADIIALTANKFERIHLLGEPLPLDGWSKPTPAQWAAGQFWHSFLHGQKKSYLSFPMIGRLAELLLRVNPLAREALKLTYSHVFMDEFQDTTQVQYDLVRTIFLGSAAVVTAVGDNKQQIMRWALAMADPFGAFEADFGARRTPLYNNYRSSPELVRIQHILAQALDAKAVKPTSKVFGSIDGDSCAIWEFTTPQTEAKRLATFVVEQMNTHNLIPRDFAIIVRQKAGDYFSVLAPAFVRIGLRLRNEAAQIGSLTLQELLAEEASNILVNVLHLLTSDRVGRHWTHCKALLAYLRGVAPGDDLEQARLSRDLDAFALRLGGEYATPVKGAATARVLVRAVFDFVGRDRVIAAHPAYRQGNWFDKVIEAAALHLESSTVDQPDWKSALDSYEGVHSAPLMTIHKSKGLEYHTVIFVGLDDGAWWSFAKDRVEGTAGFFVAFTRAKQRVVFTYCSRRGDRKEIASLYELLRLAGVSSTPAD